LPARVPKTVKKVTMTRRTRARHGSANEAGLLLHLRHSTLHSLYHASLFASLASVVYVGWDLMVRYLCLRGLLASARTIWIFLPTFKYFFCDLSSDKVYQSPQTRLTPNMVRHSISQCTILSFRYPHFPTKVSIMHSSGTCLSFSE
jgi:hypothetical protein